MEVHLSQDNYLLSKSYHQSQIKRVVKIEDAHWRVLEWIMRDKDDKANFSKKPPQWKELMKDDVSEDSLGILKIYEYMDYENGDVIVFYDDIGILSGSRGYLLIRGGYVCNSYAMWRS